MKRFVASLLLVLAVLLAGVSSSLAARLVAQVNLSNQTMTVKKNGRVLYRWAISSGRKGYRTPTGTYSPKRMHKMWYSRKYDMSPMPYSIFFRGGYAIHGTNYVSRLGRPASHGCIRLRTSHARTLYNLTRQVGPANMRVSISY
ncbi:MULTISPECIES: L,D-transpeptidase [unclassified Roseitalea]|uniref:L,D-transpeptidase n=1 Tax=unclassified Roseitalea TaxID=2639107 RepID=UPI00273FA32A|nr:MULTISPECIES: L,D-transpeptidase [unclassified Roseitalea]